MIYLLDTEVLLPRKNLRQTLRKEFSNYIRVLADLTLKIFEDGAYQQVLNAAGGEENIISLREICVAANPEVVIENGSENLDYGFIMDIQNAINLGWQPRVEI
ncbi:MAG: hypothetical protein EBZ52_03980 [Actinobacteria bacterium]|nr:hypothetical protein [Actinomycetota bacterium]